ncbi:class I SAM-dependent methyltransferase, partial [Patescibacteria group bacterium]|nr:class I SAM-dependent methyltransferase [Patescibacteria group bacterium]
CGSGNAVVAASRIARHVEGWDNNRACISFLQKTLKDRNITNAEAFEKDLLHVKTEKKFTKILLTEVIEHFSDGDTMNVFYTMNKLLLPNGKIFVTTPNDLSLWPLYEEVLNKIQTIPKLKERHLSRYTMNKLVNILKKAHFTLEVSGTMNSIAPFMFFLPETLRDKLSVWEAKHLPFGGLLYVVACKV